MYLQYVNEKAKEDPENMLQVNWKMINDKIKILIDPSFSCIS